MAWTDPKTFTVGEVLTAADMNTYVRDNALAMHLPVGSVMDYAGTADPADTAWLIGDGRELDRVVYADFFALVGTTFGVGDGSATFNMPNLTGKMTLGVSGSHPLGSTGGEETHLLTAAESGLPDHTHYVGLGTGASANTINDTAARHAGGSDALNFPNTVQSVQGGARNASAAHNNMPPFVALSKIVKVLA